MPYRLPSIILAAFFALACVPAPVAASLSKDAAPEEVAGEYLIAGLEQRYADRYDCVCAADKQAISLEDYIADSKAQQGPGSKVLLANTSFKTTDVKIDGDTATVKAKMTMPDSDAIMADLAAVAMSYVTAGKEIPEIDTLLKQQYKGKKMPLTTIEREFNLVREDGAWKLDLGWLRLAALAEDPGVIDKLLAQAKQLQSQHRPKEAQACCLDVLALDSSNAQAQALYDQLAVEVASYEDEQAYIGKIELYQFSALLREGTGGAQVPAVEFKLKNTGERTLSDVEVTVYFLDESGNAIHEAQFHPLASGSDSASRLLKPGYIWQMPNDSVFEASGVPSEWQPGSATAEITRIEFLGGS